jgi:hypothetical protein
MNVIPPPVSPSASSSNSGYTPTANESVKASPFPIAIAVILMVGSSILWIFTRGEVVPVYIPLLGYLLTPFLVVVMMGWDTIDQRKKMAKDPWFIPKPKFTMILRGLTVLSFMVAFPHIWRLAQTFAEYLPEPVVDLLLRMSGS